MTARPTWNAIAVLMIATLTFTLPAPAAETVPLVVTLGPGSVLWLEGTSTIHDFESRSNEVAVELSRAPDVAQPTDAAGFLALIRSSAVRGVLVQVPVGSLRSEKAALDKNLRRAMRADEHPSVRFQLRQYVVTARSAVCDTVTIVAEGSLTVAGQERTVTLEARAFRAADGLWLEGSETLRMSEYGIKPPTMMLGTLKVRDPVTVRYRLFLIPEGEGASPPPHRSN